MKKFKEKSMYKLLFIMILILGLSFIGFVSYELFKGPNKPTPVYYEPDEQ